LYFDERPKDNKKSLYNREEELSKLVNELRKGAPLILLLGLRRVGKTSLLYTALNESKQPSILVDCREFEEHFAVSYRNFLGVLERSVSKLIGKYDGLRRYLKRIKGVTLGSFGVQFSFEDKPQSSIIALLNQLNSWGSDQGYKVVLALDEAQELRKVRGLNIQSILAYTYDRLRNIVTVLTGSQVGMLHRFLQVENPKTPLYGRSVVEIAVRRLNDHDALDFLMKGFDQLGVKANTDMLDYCVQRLDGIPGWLTSFGARAVREGVKKEVVDRVLETGSHLVADELKRFLVARGIAERRYRLILRRLAEEPASWTQLKIFLEAKEGKRISPSIFTQLLNNFVDSGFVEKSNETYRIPDPILLYGIKAGLV